MRVLSEAKDLSFSEGACGRRSRSGREDSSSCAALSAVSCQLSARISPLECAVPRFPALTPLECAVTKTRFRKSFRMRSSKKRWGEPPSFCASPSAPPIREHPRNPGTHSSAFETTPHFHPISTLFVFNNFQQWQFATPFLCSRCNSGGGGAAMQDGTARTGKNACPTKEVLLAGECAAYQGWCL